jgi:transcriptional regulator with XRE-family HTH domain
MQISKVIRDHGYTIEQVAERIGLKRGSLANMIGGNPTVETLQKIADAIGCNRSEFFQDEDNGGDRTIKPSVPEITCPRCWAQIRLKVEEGEE